MDRLISFLLNNIFLVVIVIGFLLSVFGRRGRPPQRMPDFGGGDRPGRPGAPQRRPEQRQTPQRAEPRRTASRPGPADAPAHEAAPQPSPFRSFAGEPGEGEWGGEGARPRPTRLKRVEPMAAEASQPLSDRSSGGALPSVGAEELRRAVLWAEILGPPRAKRPPGRRSF